MRKKPVLTLIYYFRKSSRGATISEVADRMLDLRAAPALGITVVFLCGVVCGTALAKKTKIPPDLFKGKTPIEASAALVGLARQQAGNGSWERIAVGRVLYLAGDKKQAQEIFDEVLTKPEISDLVRIARVYAEAGELDKAIKELETALARDPKDKDVVGTLGAYVNLNGDRERAEVLFADAFARDDEDAYLTCWAAGSYRGVHPN